MICIRSRGRARIPSLSSIARSLPCWSRAYTSPTAAAAAATTTNDLSHSNPLGIQLLPPAVHSQLFSSQQLSSPLLLPARDRIAISRSHLTHHNLLTKPPSSSPPIAFDLPALAGKTLDEHFYRLGMELSSPYLRYACKFATVELPPTPAVDKWVQRAGWTKYYPDGRTEAVAAPEEECLVFDVEVLYKISPFAVVACAASPHAWYAWLSPWVLGETENDRQLISLGNPETARIVVGHNIGYDRRRVKEEYNIVQTASTYLDTMSLHVASTGTAATQRSKLMNRKGAVPTTSDGENTAGGAELEESDGRWVGQNALRSLKDVALFHCGITMDKTTRHQFGILSLAGVCKQLNKLLSYCAEDVAVTHKVYQKVLPRFLEVCPHPVSFAALRHVSSAILPVNRGWEAYIANAEATCHRLSDGVKERLVNLAEQALELKNKPEIYTTDPWLQQLDWSGQEIKLAGGESKSDPLRSMARRKQPGMPNWYNNLFLNSTSPISITVRTRIAPLLLRMMWDGYPLVWSNTYGWTFRISKRPGEQNADMDAAIEKYSVTVKRCNMSLETDPGLRDDTEGVYFKIPHKNGPEDCCFNPFTKDYQRYFDSGILSSKYAPAKEALEMNAKCAYWIVCRGRIMEQVVVWQSDTDFGLTPTAENPEVGIILPLIIPMGTVTRRTVELTWHTAPTATPCRVGSEIKAMVTSPPGYVFVGADIDSEELWIASLVGDAVLGFHGGSALGFMNIEGTKAEQTDVHSKTADMLGITRDGAKVINYSRLYGAGVNSMAKMLLQMNPGLSPAQAGKITEEMDKETKGRRTYEKKIHNRKFWRGGTESFIFNKLESFVEHEKPRTPVLGAGMTMGLIERNLSPKESMASRISWVMQSSGVDYLHLLLVAMEYLIRRYSISARVSITIHDEVRYLCKEEDKYRCAMALQVANLWTRAMFSQQMGINDLPQSVAYFSAIDIDHVLRKEVDMPCVTPSHPDPIPPGESLDIMALLAKGAEARLDPEVVPRGGRINLERWKYMPRESVIDTYRGEDTVAYLKAQIARMESELEEIVGESNRGFFGGGEIKMSKKAIKRAEQEAMKNMKGAEKREMIAEKKARRARKKQMKEKIGKIEQKINEAERTLAYLRAEITGKKVVYKEEKLPTVVERTRMVKRLVELKRKMAQVGYTSMEVGELGEMLYINGLEQRRQDMQREQKRERKRLRMVKKQKRAEEKLKRKAQTKLLKKEQKLQAAASGKEAGGSLYKRLKALKTG